MKDQKNDELELKLKTLTEILEGLSLPELSSVQDLLSKAIKNKCTSIESEHIGTMTEDKSSRLLKDYSRLSEWYQYFHWLRIERFKTEK